MSDQQRRVTYLANAPSRGQKIQRGGGPFVLNALIYIPIDVTLDAHLELAYAHIQRHGYELVNVVRDPAEALSLCDDGHAQVIVFAKAEHVSPAFAPRVEICGGETQDLMMGRKSRNERYPDAGQSPRPRLVY